MSCRILLSLRSSRIAITKLKSITNSQFSTILFNRLPVSSISGHRNLHSHSSELGNSLIDPSLKIHLNDNAVHQNDYEDETTNEFLSRFAWIMRKKVKEVYPECDKSTVDGMLVLIVERVVSEMEKGGGGAEKPVFDSVDFSEDLWKTVWEVSNKVLVDMNKERKKEKMKSFLQCDEVKEMCRFAGEVGIRGNLLRELRFKWAREKMEEHEFYEDLEKLRKEGQVIEEGIKHESDTETDVGVCVDGNIEEKGENKVVGLPKRKGKLKFKIYGLDLSDPKWEQVADRIHEAGEVLWPKEAKPITGKCKQVTERILALKEEDGDDSLLTLLAEWIELLQPARVDWFNLLERLKNQNSPLYFKVAEKVLTEDSFQTNISDYSRLIDMYAKENRIDDTERMLEKMNENGIQPDTSIASVLVHMYSKIGNLEGAEEAFKILSSHGFQPDSKVYNSMIIAYINAGEPTKGETLMRQMETRDIQPTKEIYMALLRYYSQCGDFDRASRTSTSMQFAGHQQTLETCTLLIEAAAAAVDCHVEKVSSNFDHMVQLGHKPNDRCAAAMIRAYERTNSLDKALDLLLTLEKDGFEPGVATYSVLMEWMAKMQLVDETEQILNKIALLGEAPPFRVQVSLCDMYARTKMERKALQTLGVLIARKDELRERQFERIITGLISGGFLRDAQRMHEIMESQGFKASGLLISALKSGDLPCSMR
ncbi:pentatricopeptide repeat-containing protein [Trifolium pratense]|uniref:Pentatricopeptide repeat-containing protein n=1 Tax=Trifolium pratense TaxID=57577 RepID=A0A2K3P6M8_TRIPR|nr:pentatricopeptide repeat-containing protein [Trifolium pratense]